MAEVPVPRRQWTEDEIKVALLLYFQIPFGKIDSRNRDIVELAERLHRTPSAVAMKLLNLSSLDDRITGTGRVGLANASALDRAVWTWFQSDWSEAVAGAAEVFDRFGKGASGLKESPVAFGNFPTDGKTEAIALSKHRVGQNFFRNAVLSNFETSCCITGISVPELLCASHIVPWAKDASQRLNPANGLCLSPTLDRAFDRGFVCFRPDRSMKLSDDLLNQSGPSTRAYFSAFVDAQMRPSTKVEVSHENLSWHRSNRFEHWKRTVSAF